MHTSPEGNGQQNEALDRLTRLQALTASLSEAVTSEQVAEVILAQAAVVLGTCSGVVVRLSDDSEELVCLHASGYSEEVVEALSRFPADARLPLSDAVRDGKAVLLASRAERDACYPDLACVPGIRGEGALVGLPLVVRGKTIGGLGLRFPTERSFTEPDLAFLLAIAGLCAQALERAQLYDTERAARERAERAEDALRASEQRHRLLSALTSDFTFGLRFVAEGPPLVEWVSESFSQLSGFSLEELNSRGGWPTLVHPDDLPITLGTVERMRMAQRDEAEVRLVVKSGEIRWVRYLTHPVCDEAGKVTGFVGAAQDIHPRKQAELALRASEERLRAEQGRLAAVVENLPTGVVVAEAPTGKIVLSNKQAVEICGQPFPLASDIEGYSEFRGFHPDGRPYEPHEWPLARSIASGERVSREEIELLRRDGTRRVMRVSSAPIRDERGGIAAGVVVLADVTEEKRATEALRISEERFVRFMHHLPGLAWIKDVKGRYVYANEAAVKAFGKSRMELHGRTDEEVFPPATAAQFQENDRKALTSGTGVRTIETLEQPDGVVHHSVVSKFPIPGPDGTPSLVGGMAIDITEEMRTRAVLEESEERFRATFEQAAVGIAHVGLDGRWLRVNRKLCDIVGCSSEELLALTFQDITHPDDLETDLAQVRRLLAGEIETYSLEKRYFRKDRSVVWVTLTVALVRTPQDRPKYFISVVEDITEEKQVRDALRDSEKQFRKLADSIAQLCWMARPDGDIFWYNRRWLEYTGTTPEQMKGSGWESVLDPEERLAVLTSWKAALASGEPWEDMFPLRRHDGQMRWHLTRAIPVRDEQGRVVRWFGTNTDIQDRREAEARLSQHAARQRLLWEAAAVLLTTDEADAMLRRLFASIAPHLGLQAYFNYRLTESKDALRLASSVGIPDEEARRISRLELGQGVCGTVAQERRPIAVSFIQESDDPKVQLLKGYGIRAYTCIPLLAGDRLLGTLSFASRARDRFEDEELEFLRTVCQYVTFAHERLRLVKELREADRRKDNFLAILAHELRNPLAPLRNGLQVMKLASGNALAVDQSRSMMERQLAQMVRLIDDLLDVSRITRGKLQLRRERVELASVVRSAVEGSRPMIEASGHRLVVTLPPGPVWLEADPTRLAQVYSNLLTNAAKYTDRGGNISLSAHCQGSEVVVVVRDNGIGIDTEQLPRLFQMFSQVDTALERSQGGLGIGLALVKGLVELQGGSVKARSEGLGKGSEFVVRLPVASETSASQLTQPGSGEKATARRKRRILVADDNRDAADSLALLLRLGGHDVHAVHDGQEAVDTADWLRPDVAFVDLGMPKLNGFEVARHFRQQPWGRQVALVAITGWGQEEDKRRAAEAGFDQHLTKPADPAALEKLLADLEGRTG